MSPSPETSDSLAVDGSSRWAVVGVSVAFAVTMMGTTLPTPLYLLYKQTVGFSDFLITVIYAVYALGVLATLLIFGSMSDRVGRRPMLLVGLALSAGSAVTLLAHVGEPELFLARVLSGLSAGLFTGTATAFVIDLAAPDRRPRATLVAAVVNTLGLGLGSLISGLVSQYVGLPLRTIFILDLALLVPATIAILHAPEPVQVSNFRFELTRLAVPAEVRAVFVQATVAGFAGFVVLGYFSAVVPSALGQLLGQHNRAVLGLVVFAAFLASVAGQIAAERVGADRSLPLGCGILIAGMGLLAAGLDLPSLALLVLGGVVAGIGQGLSFRAGLGLISAPVAAQQRGAVTSAFFTLLYIGISLPVVIVGIATRSYGLQSTGVVTAGGVAALAAASVVILVVRRDASGAGSTTDRRSS